VWDSLQCTPTCLCCQYSEETAPCVAAVATAIVMEKDLVRTLAWRGVSRTRSTASRCPRQVYLGDEQTAADQRWMICSSGGVGRSAHWRRAVAQNEQGWRRASAMSQREVQQRYAETPTAPRVAILARSKKTRPGAAHTAGDAGRKKTKGGNGACRAGGVSSTSSMSTTDEPGGDGLYGEEIRGGGVLRWVTRRSGGAIDTASNSADDSQRAVPGQDAVQKGRAEGWRT
jgi:hypothetical protein